MQAPYPDFYPFSNFLFGFDFLHKRYPNSLWNFQFAMNLFVNSTHTHTYTRAQEFTTFCQAFSIFHFFLFSFVFLNEYVIICFHCGQRPFPWHIIRSPIERLLDFTILFSMLLSSWAPKFFHSFFSSSYTFLKHLNTRTGHSILQWKKETKKIILFYLRIYLDLLQKWFRKVFYVWFNRLSRREPKS